ncbi:MAG: hypothetical protein ACREJG_12285 [Candidatus Rokuibacteriota bacterium]
MIGVVPPVARSMRRATAFMPFSALTFRSSRAVGLEQRTAKRTWTRSDRRTRYRCAPSITFWAAGENGRQSSVSRSSLSSQNVIGVRIPLMDAIEPRFG